MTGIELYSTTAANNNSAAPNGFPEGMPPSGVNDSARQMMAAIRTWYETAEWINLGYTPTYVSGTSFTLVGDKTSEFQVGRRVKLVGTTPFTRYGTIATSVYSSVTTVTVTMDSGTIDSSISAVSYSINSVTNTSLSPEMLPTLLPKAGGTVTGTLNISGAPLNLAKGSDIASASTINLTTATGNTVDVTGTTTITAITLAEGATRYVRFTGILTLTHGSSLVLPTGANITTAAGDYAVFIGYAAGVVRCAVYTRASGVSLVSTAPSSAIVATSTNDDAAAGRLGEYKTASIAVGAAVSLVTATSKTVTSLSLEAGDWLAQGTVLYTGNSSTTITTVGADVSSVNNTGTTYATINSTGSYTLGSIGAPIVQTRTARFSLASTTTIYLIARADFAVSTLSAYGIVNAWRPR